MAGRGDVRGPQAPLFQAAYRLRRSRGGALDKRPSFGSFSFAVQASSLPSAKSISPNSLRPTPVAPATVMPRVGPRLSVPTIVTLLGQKTHNITRRYVGSANAILVAAADAVANARIQCCGGNLSQTGRFDSTRRPNVHFRLLLNDK